MADGMVRSIAAALVDSRECECRWCGCNRRDGHYANCASGLGGNKGSKAMIAVNFDLARAYARPDTIDSHPTSVTENLRRAYTAALEALESEVSGREHDLTAKILGPRMPDRAERYDGYGEHDQ